VRTLVTFLLSLLMGCASAGDAFKEASNAAYDIIEAEASSPFCRPIEISTLQRKKLSETLSSVTSAGLSDPTGLTPLDYAVLADDVPSIKRFISLGYSLNTRDIHGGTPLHAATLVGAKQALAYLLANGANPNSANTYGGTPLMVAVAENRPEIALTLLAAGVSASLSTSDGGTALSYATFCQNQELIQALLAAGSNIGDEARTRTLEE